MSSYRRRHRCSKGRKGRIYDTDRWRYIVRPAVLQRDGYRCRVCGSDLYPEVDHIVPIERGGAEFDLDNLQVLCKFCHSEKTGREKGGRVRSPEEIEWAIHRKGLFRNLI